MTLRSVGLSLIQTVYNTHFSETETHEEGQARPTVDLLQHRRQCQINPDNSLWDQHAVRSKLTKFHSALASLQFHSCSTCNERFPNLTVVPLSNGFTECRRCNQDKRIPKVYSFANNMNPGHLPQQLKVGNPLVGISNTAFIICPFSHYRGSHKLRRCWSQP